MRSHRKGLSSFLLVLLLLLLPVQSLADTLIASDTFSAASGDLVTQDANWTINGPNAMKITSGGLGIVQATTAGVDSGARWNANSFPDNQYSKVVLGTSNNTGSSQGQGYGPAVRWDTSGAVKTGFRFVCDTHGYELGQFVSGTFTSISSAASPTCANGDTIYLSVTTSGSDAVFVVKQNGTPITGSPFTKTGGSTSIPSGSAGIAHSSTTTIDSVTGIDSWEGGNLTTAGATKCTLELLGVGTC